MFYSVGEQDVHAEVYALDGARQTMLDPHEIFATRWVGYDNIHRNILVTVLEASLALPFCGYLKRKFPGHDDFVVAQAHMPSVITDKRTLRQGLYRCGP